MQLKFEVMGKVTGKARVRFSRVGHTFTPNSNMEYEFRIQQALKQSMDKLHLEGVQSSVRGFTVAIRAFYKVRDSYSKKKQQQCLDGLVPCPKPDVDNIAKIVMDALNGLLWKDDQDVITLVVGKQWAYEEKIQVGVKWEQVKLEEVSSKDIPVIPSNFA